jgi:hypothetical protein
VVEKDNFVEVLEEGLKTKNTMLGAELWRLGTDGRTKYTAAVTMTPLTHQTHHQKILWASDSIQ